MADVDPARQTVAELADLPVELRPPVDFAPSPAAKLATTTIAPEPVSIQAATEPAAAAAATTPVTADTTALGAGACTSPPTEPSQPAVAAPVCATPTTEPPAAPASEPLAAPTTEPPAAPASEPPAAPASEPLAAPASEPPAAPAATATEASLPPQELSAEVIQELRKSSKLLLLARIIRRGDPVVFVTGAGLSTASGIPTFRGKDGVWSKFIMEWGTRGAFLANPRAWWNHFWLPAHVVVEPGSAIERSYEPSGGHLALAQLAAAHKNTNVKVVTQNIDGLHGRAGLTARVGRVGPAGSARGSPPQLRPACAARAVHGPCPAALGNRAAPHTHGGGRGKMHMRMHMRMHMHTRRACPLLPPCTPAMQASRPTS